MRNYSLLVAFLGRHFMSLASLLSQGLHYAIEFTLVASTFHLWGRGEGLTRNLTSAHCMTSNSFF